MAYILSAHFTPRSTRPVSDDPFIFIRLGSLPLRYICVNLSNCVPHNLPFSSRFSSDVPFVFHTSLRTRFILFAAIYQPRCVVYFRSPFYDSLPLPACFFQWRSFFFERYFTRTTKCIRTVIHNSWVLPSNLSLLRSCASRWRQHWITSWNEDFVFSPNDSSLVVPILGPIDSID